ncbi:MAG: tetratricopeptide repeat protein [Bacteroidia bacterium]|nr:tetratricopeptide repeat protein [Bacteroidia bacterium]MBT8275399.1 tetratricopeptide repeat protein [Bacteroidia bacterium]NNF30895.1 tetratricopeptide repeat protein [Flavobacteriaceae bacterium]NNK54508.1 tetratricopeptide repeat protein [Flavobacteriaceae bacterium]NNM08020.1 tetratricopeptide repeat protein [Flavobacteriaceae bacterium]
MKRFIYFFGIVLLLASCRQETSREQITDPIDYNKYLATASNPTYDEALNEVEFWSKRLRPDSSGVGDLGPLAAAYTKLFQATGNASYLSDAESLYMKAMAISANNKDIYARGLARTYISQHRFKEAEEILRESYQGISSKRATEFMLFDALMELGNYDEAETFLKKLQNTSDYNYLIRKAKWSDHKGDLTNAINYMETAKDIAESRDSKTLKIWTYSNLGDFYGHDGRIRDAYLNYLKTLELQPDNAYVKKGIAWIAYSYEEDVEEVRRILDSVMVNHKVPDYYLILADMAEYEGNEKLMNSLLDKFIETASSNVYGAMYNTSLIEVLTESRPEKARRMAEIEIENRPTPEIYALLAYTMAMTGDKEEAGEIIDSHVRKKTFEPMSLYFSASVYKLNGNTKELKGVKKELEEASFELGPVLVKKIKEL